jgi:hypothetical protein
MEGGRQFELRFAGLFNMGRGDAFPCDADCNVDVGLLSERARASSLRACATVGRESMAPVRCVRPHSR